MNRWTGMLFFLLFTIIGFGCPGQRDFEDSPKRDAGKKRKDLGKNQHNDLQTITSDDFGNSTWDSYSSVPDQNTTTGDSNVVVTPAGFGDICSQAKPCDTAQGVFCIRESESATQGFCTKPCSNPGGDCTDYPSGTLAACLRQATVNGQQTYICAFICRDKTDKWPCPSTLQCVTTDIPDLDGCVLP